MDSTLTKLMILCKVGICLVRYRNSKHRQTVSSETAGDIINTIDVKKTRGNIVFWNALKQYCK